MNEMHASQHESPEDRSEHVAPNCSPEHVRLRGLARRSGQNEQTLRDLLWLINAHDRLLGLDRIAANLLQIVEMGEDEAGNDSGQQGDLAVFRGWREVLYWLSDTFPEPRRISTALQQGECPILGYGITRHPLYGCLWFRSVVEPKQYLLLQRYLLIAHAGYLYRESQNDWTISRTQYEAYGSHGMWCVFPNSPEEAMRSVRKMAEGKWGPLLAELPVEKHPAEFPKALGIVKCPDRLGPELWKDWPSLREDIQFFLEKVYDQRPWVEREGGRRGVSLSHNEWNHWSIDATPGDADDPDDRWVPSRWLTVSKPESGLNSSELLDLDLCPDEIEELQHWLLVAPDQPDIRQLAIESALAARGQSRHVQLVHQLLPWEYSQLTVQELAHLLHETSDAFRSLSKSDWSDDEYHTAELVTLLHVMLWTGSPLERAWDLRVLTGRETKQFRKQAIENAGLLFDLAKPGWYIRAISPPYKSEIPDPLNQTYPRAASFYLPDHASTASFLRAFLAGDPLKRAKPTANPNPAETETERSVECNRRLKEGYVFRDTLEHYRDGLKEWVDRPAHNLTGRITLHRIATFIFNRLVAITGDVMAGVLITGRDHPLARTQRFYSAYSASRLQQIYCEATGTAVRQAHQAAGREPPPPPKDVAPDEEHFIGARLCLRRSEAEKAISGLEVKICKSRSITDRDSLEAFHNFYTLWTVLMFDWATSMRAIRTPYLSPEAVDQITGFTFLSDKDDDAQHKTRLAWVPPFVQEQMRAYADHLSALASDNLDVRTWHEPCFFLAKGKPFEVRPKTLSEKLRLILAVPPNSHRRFMRHELLREGCPQEVVNAWLGHAFQGEEIWGPYSSLSFFEYRNNLKAFLLPILKGLGWEVINSPLV